jgi:hypothetical protein
MHRRALRGAQGFARPQSLGYTKKESWRRCNEKIFAGGTAGESGLHGVRAK